MAAVSMLRRIGRFRGRPGLRRPLARHRTGRVRGPPRTFWLRQVDPAQRRGRVARRGIRADLDRRQERHLGGAQGPRHRDGVPVLCALPANERAREHVVRPEDGEDAEARDRRRVKHAAELLQITHLLDRRPDQLSGGQRQRVAIGRALVRDAAVFLFDEPLSNLDAMLRNELRVEIKRLHARLGQATMIYVTHDQIEAMTLADRIVVMQDQKVQQIGSPDEVYRRPSNLFVAGFIGSPQMNFIRGRLEVDGGFAFTARNRRLPLDGYEFTGRPTRAGSRPRGPSGASGARRGRRLAGFQDRHRGADGSRHRDLVQRRRRYASGAHERRTGRPRRASGWPSDSTLRRSRCSLPKPAIDFSASCGKTDPVFRVKRCAAEVKEHRMGPKSGVHFWVRCSRATVLSSCARAWPDAPIRLQRTRKA